ncbi:hypothetical protein GALL_553920 [mine drainage metagenome]|uniref:Uncharacterized protein n=1 Tax=mine drainage metagenome TaxID=410659 RepID=A0A1J5NV40_9ZZZZ
MGKVHQRVAPAGDLDPALRVRGDLRQFGGIVEKTQFLRLLQRHPLGVGQMRERLRQPLRILRGQGDLRPDLGAGLPLRQGLLLHAGFDGQQA